MEEEKFKYSNWNFGRGNNPYARPVHLSETDRATRKENRKAGIATVPYIDSNVYAQNKYGYVLSHNSQLENPLELDKFVNTKYHKGWKWNKNVDLDGDGNFDTVVYDASGKPVVWNGYHYVPNVNMLERENFMRDPNNAQYNYSIKKFKYEIKSDFEKALSELASSLHKGLKVYFPVIPNDLSSSNLKTIIKHAYMIPVLIQKGYIRQITIEQYVDELIKFGEYLKAKPNAKASEAKSLMALYRRATQVLDSLPQAELQSLLSTVQAYIHPDNVANICSKYLPIKGVNKVYVVLELIQNLTSGGISTDDYTI